MDRPHDGRAASSRSFESCSRDLKQYRRLRRRISTSDEASLHNWVLANQRMAAAPKAKGYHYRFVFAEGSGRTDQAVINQTLPEAVVYLWQDYPIK
jgi:hypothetical protein